MCLFPSRPPHSQSLKAQMARFRFLKEWLTHCTGYGAGSQGLRRTGAQRQCPDLTEHLLGREVRRCFMGALHGFCFMFLFFKSQISFLQKGTQSKRARCTVNKSRDPERARPCQASALPRSHRVTADPTRLRTRGKGRPPPAEQAPRGKFSALQVWRKPLHWNKAVGHLTNFTQQFSPRVLKRNDKLREKNICSNERKVFYIIENTGATLTR